MNSASFSSFLPILNKQKSKSYRGDDMADADSLTPVRSGNRLETSDLSDNGWTRFKRTPSRK
jgi:hypothetical protein